MDCMTPCVALITTEETNPPVTPVVEYRHPAAVIVLINCSGSSARVSRLVRNCRKQQRRRPPSRLQPRPQALSSSRQANLYRPQGPAQPACRLFVSQALEVTKHNGKAVLLRKPLDLGMQLGVWLGIRRLLLS